MTQRGKKAAVLLAISVLGLAICGDRIGTRSARRDPPGELCVELDAGDTRPLLVCADSREDLARAAAAAMGANCDELVGVRDLPACERVSVRVDGGRCRLDPAAQMTGARRLGCGRGLDPNSDAAADLALLPGIGEVRARAIVDYREKNGPYEEIGDLTRIKGIGEKTVDRLAPWLEIEPSTGDEAVTTVGGRRGPTENTGGGSN